MRNREDFGLASFEAALDAQGRAKITIQQSPPGTPTTEPRPAHVFIEYLGDSTFVPRQTLVQFTVLPTAGA